MTQRTTVTDNLHGQFIQRKQLRDIPFPIVSSGTFNVAINTGLYWNTQQPVASQLLISKTRIVQYDSGKEVASLDVERNPLIGLIGAIFVSALTGDHQQLEEHFDSQAALAEYPYQWQTTLTPKQPLLKKFSHKIELFGSQTIEKIIIYDASGDITSIELHSLTAAPASE